MTWEGLTPPYRTIVVDPPWPYDRDRGDGQVSPPAPRYIDEQGRLRSSGLWAASAPLRYSSLTIDEIMALPVGELAQDARCFLWITNHYLHHGWSILDAWGFQPQHRALVWCKPPRATAQVTTEFILIGKRGKPPRMPWHGTTWFQWPLQPVHSQKPAAFMDLVESWCPGPYVELFARSPRLGWDSWGYGWEQAS